MIAFIDWLTGKRAKRLYAIESEIKQNRLEIEAIKKRMAREQAALTAWKLINGYGQADTNGLQVPTPPPVTHDCGGFYP